MPWRILLGRLEEGIIALLLAAMTLLTFVQVVLRYVFDSGLDWGLEATTYLFAWLVLFGMSYVARMGAHIGVDVVVKLLPPGLRRAVGLLAALIAVAYCGLITYGATVYIDKLWVIGVQAQDVPLPRWLLSIILPIGFVLLGIRFLQAAWAILTGQADTMLLGDEGTDALRMRQPATDAGGEAGSAGGRQ